MLRVIIYGMPSNLSMPEASEPTVYPSQNMWVPIFGATAQSKQPVKLCSLCGHKLYSLCYRTLGRTLCEPCAVEVRSGSMTARSSSMVGALLAGIVGVFAGTFLYTIIASDTTWFTGYCTVLVGWFVGRTMIAGAGGVGSFQLQALAAALTYIGMTLTALPVAIWLTWQSKDSIGKWGQLFTHYIVPGLAAPFAEYDPRSFTSAAGFFTLALGVFVATRLTRSKPAVVSGPFDIFVG